MSDFLAKDLMDRYRQSLWDGIARNIRNIYLANVKAYCLKERLKNAAQMEIEPDEAFMRFVEGDLKESEVEDWRMSVWEDWKHGSILSMNCRLGQVFADLAKTYQMLHKALMVYPNDLSI